MPEFHLDTSGSVEAPEGVAALDAMPEAIEFRHLDDFTQGYIEAVFFAEFDEPGRADIELDGGHGPTERIDIGFENLAPQTLAAIIADCDAFKLRCVHVQPLMGDGNYPDERQAGRDFLYTRNGHGCGFWDGDWPEPHDDDLTQAAKSFGQVEFYVGDDRLIYGI